MADVKYYIHDEKHLFQYYQMLLHLVTSWRFRIKLGEAYVVQTLVKGLSLDTRVCLTL